MLLAALAGGAMFYRTARQWSTVAATGAVVAWLLLPRMFAHLHFASFDGPLTSCWILAWATFAPARRSADWAVLWGLALGATLSCKATGWIAPVPFVIWALAYRDRPAFRALLIGLPVATATFYLLNPPLWHHPIDGFRAFLDLNLHRADRPWHNVATQFFGRMCDLDHPLPWYNTIVWTAITVPLGILALTAAGVTSTVRCLRSEPAGSLVLGHWLILLVVRALPMAPPHDGVRLLLPSFAFLAVLAGIGCGFLWRWTSRQRSAGHIAPRWLAATGIGLLYLTSAGSLLWYAPQWLSYYNPLIGGLPGATARGMEPTYYWDALDRPTLDWLNENTAEGEKISFAAAPPENLMLMRRWGWLQHPWQEDVPGRWAWRVVQHRPSSCQPADRRLIEREPAAYEKTIRQGGWGPWRLDVRLIGVFPYPRYVEARRADSAP